MLFRSVADEGFCAAGGFRDATRSFEAGREENAGSATNEGFGVDGEELLGEDSGTAHRSTFSMAACCHLNGTTNSCLVLSIFARFSFVASNPSTKVCIWFIAATGGYYWQASVREIEGDRWNEISVEGW